MLAFDILLAVFLLILSAWLVVTEDTFLATVIFISFGLLMSLSWVRLSAPDIALAEAAIGAGLLGALFLSYLARSGPSDSGDKKEREE